MSEGTGDGRYTWKMGSGLGGMSLELWDCTTDKLILWALYSDTDGSITFERYQDDISAETEAWFRQEAQRKLPPLN